MAVLTSSSASLRSGQIDLAEVPLERMMTVRYCDTRRNRRISASVQVKPPCLPHPGMRTAADAGQVLKVSTSDFRCRWSIEAASAANPRSVHAPLCTHVPTTLTEKNPVIQPMSFIMVGRPHLLAEWLRRWGSGFLTWFIHP